MSTPVFQQDEGGIAVEKIMDENVPGWRDRALEFETFNAYCKWIDDCVRGVLTQESERKDH
jgi:hypothetical protein